jgi:hypothetical protein
VTAAWLLPTRASSAMAGSPLRTVTVSDDWLAARSTPMGYCSSLVTAAPTEAISSMPTRSASRGKSAP